MDLAFLSESDQLTIMSQNPHVSIEQFLCDIEEQLERGELTIDEASQLIQDFSA